MTIRDIEIIQQERDQELEPEESVPAVMTAVGGNVKVPGRAGYVFIKEFNQPDSLNEVLNVAGVQAIDGNMVELARPNQTGDKQVVGLWGGIVNFVTDDDDMDALSIAPHRTAHQYPSEASKGSDAVLIYQPALQHLKCTGDGATLVVSVAALPAFRHNDTRKVFAGATYDMTASVPGAGLVRTTLVYLNAQTNALAIVDGTAVPDTGAVPIPEPPLPEHGIGSAYIRLANGQADVTTADDVTDSREFLEPRVSDTLQEATAVGQILISNDGVVFEPGIPVVDGSGDLLTDGNGHIIVV